MTDIWPQDTAIRMRFVTLEDGEYQPHEMVRYTAEGAWIIHWGAIDKYGIGDGWTVLRKFADDRARQYALATRCAEG